MDFDWKGMVKTIAPGIATALGGPLAGNAVKYLEDAVLGPDQPRGDDKVLAAALQAATPEQLLALKKADQDFTLNMQKIGVDLEKLDADDRDSARKREIAVKDWIPGVLAVGITFGVFYTVYYVTHFPIPPDNKDMVVGLLEMMKTAWAIGVIGYYFGSSHGQTRTTELLAQAPPVKG